MARAVGHAAALLRRRPRALTARLGERGPDGALLLCGRPRDQAGGAPRLALECEEGAAAVHRRGGRHGHAHPRLPRRAAAARPRRRIARRPRHTDGDRHRLRHGDLLLLPRAHAPLLRRLPAHPRHRRRPGRHPGARHVLRARRRPPVPRRRRRHHRSSRAAEPQAAVGRARLLGGWRRAVVVPAALGCKCGRRRGPRRPMPLDAGDVLWRAIVGAPHHAALAALDLLHHARLRPRQHRRPPRRHLRLLRGRRGGQRGPGGGGRLRAARG
mmetsp:Transcript_37064/g.93992  ORF Transcript_37064/g.93992 Transcript_37064/m.93992 type:complete len:270 (-) Transcript_37064:394-1203(-)